MVGVINANASMSIATQIGLARKADFQLLPGEPFPSEEEQASMASLAHSATTAFITVTATDAPATTTASASGYPQGGHGGYNHDDGGSGLSTGAIAGIAVGAAIAGIIGAVLVFLCMRNRSLQKKVKEQSAQQQMQQQQYPPPGAPSPYLDSRHTSVLPPYHTAYAQAPQEQKPPGFERAGSPFQGHGGYGPYPGDEGHPRWTT
jgi:hypothetical protein